jgi:hypothetical protein
LPQIKSCGEDPLLFLAVKEALAAGGEPLLSGCLPDTAKQIRECRAFSLSLDLHPRFNSYHNGYLPFISVRISLSIFVGQVKALPILTTREVEVKPINPHYS